MNFKFKEKIKSKEAGGKNKIMAFIMRYVFIFYILIFVALIAGGYFGVINPKYNNIKKNIADKTEKKKQEFDELKNYRNELKKYKISFDSISEDNKQKVYSMLTDSSASEDLFAYMEKLITAQGLIMTKLDISKDDGQTPRGRSGSAVKTKLIPELGALNMKVNIIGVDYKALKSLLQVIENNIRIMNVMAVSFSESEQTAQIDIQTYDYKK